MSKLNNGYHPAAPVKNADHQLDFYGLSKRETFAMNAPVMPQWFVENYAEWTAKSDEKFGSGLTKSGQNKAFFAWRAYYADALLNELDKQND